MMIRFKIFLLFAFFSSAVFSQGNDLLSQAADIYKKGNYPEALSSINTLLSHDSSKAVYYIMRADIYFSLKNYNKTIEDCYKALAIDPGLPDAFFLRGKVCLVTESYAAALVMFTKAIEKSDNDENMFKAYLFRGQVYGKMYKNEEAMKDFNEAFKISPDSVALLMSMAETCLNMKKITESTGFLEKIRQIDPQYAPVYLMYGNLYYGNSDYLMAAGNYEKFIEKNPDDTHVLNQLSWCYIHLKEYDKARSAINKSMVLDQKNPLTHRIKAQMLIETGLKEEACDYLFRAFQLGYLEKVGDDIIAVYIKNCEEE